MRSIGCSGGIPMIKQAVNRALYWPGAGKRRKHRVALVKNLIPILEYDDYPVSVMMPDHEHLDLNLPERAVFAFLEDTVDRYAEKHHAKTVSHFVSATKPYPVYVLDLNGVQVCLMQAPVGAPAAVQILDWMIGYGVKKIVSAGSCGVLEDIDEGKFLIPVKALRDEGTSYHYLPPSRFVHVSDRVSKAIEKIITAHEFSFTEVMTWSTDGFFRETREKVLYRKKEGCSAVEMECSALAACAQMRGAEWGELLYAGDTLADVNQHDERGFGDGSREIALQLCMEAVKLL